MKKQRNKRRTDTIRLKFRNRKLKNNAKKWRKVKWRQLRRMYEAVFSSSYYVEDTTWNRAPYRYRAPELPSENPEEDFTKAMHIINHCIEEWYFDGKRLLVKAAWAGHAQAQFMLGHLNLEGWYGFEAPDFNLAEAWLTEAIRKGLSGGELAIARQDLQELRARRERHWKSMEKGADKIKYFKCFGRIYRRHA